MRAMKKTIIAVPVAATLALAGLAAVAWPASRALPATAEECAGGLGWGWALGPGTAGTGPGPAGT